MPNLAIFVDAGYLFVQGARAVFNTRLSRHEVQLDAGQFVERLRNWVCTQYQDSDYFRTYWYDGAEGGVATPEQQRIAALSYVKLRLGRINAAGQQKGVDTLIVRDLMVLSQERSIYRAVVLSGDEDLREGIEYSQDRGVRVTVLGILAGRSQSQSLELVREADESLVLPQATLAGTLTRSSILAAPVAPPLSEGLPGALTQDQYAVCAERFARDWVANATPAELAEIITRWPKIPQPLDAQLLSFVATSLNDRNISEERRKVMRAAFWAIVPRSAGTG